MIDILIIGSGAAGLTAALEAKKKTNNIVVLSKTYPTQSQTCQAQGGINGVLKTTCDKDNIQSHIDDTVKSAHKLGDIETIKYMCENSKESIKWLDDIGVPFSRDKNNNIAQRKLGGATHNRACYSSDYTGLKILHTLYDNCIKNDIEFLNEKMLLSFIVEDNIAKGVTYLDIQTAEVKQLLAKKVIVATGGYAGIYYGYTTNSTASTGDAISAALKIDCEVINMEYIQFHPTSMKDSCILISESARGEGGYLVTSDGKRFVDELKPRDVVARAIYEKIENGVDVFLDLRHLGLEKIKETMPQEYDLALEFMKLKLDEDLIPIVPAAHYTMGGIKTNIYGETNIKNLYAVGECSSNGVHGANRLGGNSLLEVITFGKLVVSNATLNMEIDTNYSTNKKYDIFTKDKLMIENIFNGDIKTNFYDTKKELGKLLFNDVGLFREEKRLKIALEKIEQMKQNLEFMGIEDKSKIYNTNLKEFLEFKNMIDLAKVVTTSAMQRKESRGAHYRVDFPDETNLFEKDTICKI
jgi:succinate dehydrogenase / fumarate reductase flavoprotein subunit